jgi:hypothetical protein
VCGCELIGGEWQRQRHVAIDEPFQGPAPRSGAEVVKAALGWNECGCDGVAVVPELDEERINESS